MEFLIPIIAILLPFLIVREVLQSRDRRAELEARTRHALPPGQAAAQTQAQEAPAPRTAPTRP